MKILIPAAVRPCPKEAHNFDRKGGCDNVCKANMNDSECWKEYQSALTKSERNANTKKKIY